MRLAQPIDPVLITFIFFTILTAAHWEPQSVEYDRVSGPDWIRN